MTPVADSIVTTLSLYPSLSTATLIQLAEHHGHTRDAVFDALADLVLVGRVAIAGGSVSLIVKPWDNERIPLEALAAADACRARHRPTWRDRVMTCVMVCVASAWHAVWSWIDRIRDRIAGGLVLLIVTTFFALGLCAGEPRAGEQRASDLPAWALPGILSRESSSYYTASGAVVYVDQAVGAAGELGPYQMTRAAFDQVASGDDRFARLGHDVAFAERMAVRYLHWLHARTGDWFLAVGRWNAGPHGAYAVAWRYAKDVQRRGRPRMQ